MAVRRLRNWLVAAVGASVALAILLWWMTADGPLQRIHQAIVTQHPGIDHISGAELVKQDSKNLIIFDTRQRSEYLVSHLDGATHVDPDIDTQQFLTKFGDLTKGKTVIFYCSVGARSTELASRVSVGLKLIGVRHIANLENGLFGWHNEKRPLVSQTGQTTDLIHPYSDFWGRLIDRKEHIEVVPEKNFDGV